MRKGWRFFQKILMNHGSIKKCWGSGSLPGPVLAKKVEHRDKIL